MRGVTMAVLVLVAGALLAVGQEPHDSWGNLKQLGPGEKVEIVDSSMKTFSGRLVSVSEESISLKIGKNEQSIERSKVVRVSVRDSSHRTRNMFIGAGIGGGIAIAAAAVQFGEDRWRGWKLRRVYRRDRWRVWRRSCLGGDSRQSDRLPGQKELEVTSSYELFTRTTRQTD